MRGNLRVCPLLLVFCCVFFTLLHRPLRKLPYSMTPITSLVDWSR